MGITLKEFLEIHPWEKDLKSLSLENSKPLDFLWEFELRSTPKELWPYLSDTSTTNQKLGLPKMQYVEKNGKLYGKSINLGIFLEWEEVPWQWEYPRWIQNARIYSKGFANYVRAKYIFEENSSLNKKTKLYVYFGWIPKNFFGNLLLKIAMPNIRKKYLAYLNELDTQIQNKKIIQTKDGILKNILENIFIKYKMIQEDTIQEYYELIWNYLAKQKLSFLNNIKIKKIAYELKLPLEKTIDFFLVSTKKGFFLLTWKIICPHCRGYRKELINIGELPEKEYCDVCEIEIDTSNSNNIEMIFKIHPSILQVEEEVFCAAEPAKKPHILFNKKLKDGESTTYSLEHLEEKIYRIRWKGETKYAILQISKEGVESLMINKFFNFENQFLYVKKNSTLQILNTFGKEKEFILEYYTDDQFALRPAEMFNHQTFRELFDHQVLDSKIQLDIGLQFLLLSDVVGSTRMYIEQGEGYAFKTIKKFFENSYQIVKKNKGAVIKTLGDAILASFSNEENLIQAVIDLSEFAKSNTEIKIRIITNMGKVYAVNLNTSIDYFGTPVNILAKVESFLKESEIAIPVELFETSQNVKEKLSKFNRLSRISIQYKNFEFPFYRFSF